MSGMTRFALRKLPFFESTVRDERARRPSGAVPLPLVAVVVWLAGVPADLVAQYTLTAPGGEDVVFEGDRLLEMRDRSRSLWNELQEDPHILYYTAYGRELGPADASQAYPWNAIEVVADSLAAVITPGNLREADRAYYNYAVLRMHAVGEDPDVSCDQVFAREMTAIDGFVDGWVIARTLFGGPAYDPLDEFAFAREAGVLEGMIAANGDRQLGGCLRVWRDANADAVDAYRAWRADSWVAEGE